MKYKTYTTMHCSEKTLLYQQQELHPWIYQIDKGYVVVEADNIDGKHGITDLYGPGTWFGPGLFNDKACQSALAQDGAELYRFSLDQYAAHINQDIQLATLIIEQLSRREQHLQRRLFLQQTASLPIRLAELLCYLFQHHGQQCQHGHDRDVYLSQQDLADMIGGSRQSVSQLLLSWKKHQAIDYTRGYICLEDTEKLLSLAQA